MKNVDYLDSLIHSDNERDILRALLTISMNNIDYEKAIIFIKMHISAKNNNVRRVAILCLGHVARVYRKMDIEIFLPILLREAKNDDQAIAATALEVLEDFKIFLDSSGAT